jgi:murein DD-endopeptidase MepM/ murein hydrolase activator NlpD
VSPHPSSSSPLAARRRASSFVVAAAATLAWAGDATAAAACWPPPVIADVADPFRLPACVWCPGNRGIEYATDPGTPVRAVAAGTVSFAGAVADVRYVVVRQPDGLRATYGGLDRLLVHVGDVVVAQQVVGTTERHLHLGLRDGDRYVDPTPLLGRLRWRARLVPLDGGPARPAPPPVVHCPP